MPYWCPGIQYPRFFPHPPGQPLLDRSLSIWSSITYPWWSHADYCCWFFCPWYAWKCFPKLAAPFCAKGLRWGWLAYGSLVFPSLPFWRWGWHFLFSSLQKLLLVTIIGYRLLPCNELWQPPQCSWVHPVDLCVHRLLKYSLNWSFSTKGTTSFHRLFSLVCGTWASWRPVLLVMTKAKKAFSTSAFPWILHDQVLHLIE